MVQRSLQLIVALCATLLSLGSAAAFDLTWDGKTYIPIGLRVGSDIALSFPEPVYTSAEQPSAFEQVDFGDDKTYIITPRQATDQRVFFRGATTGVTYVARFSTSLPYRPIINIVNGVPKPAAVRPGATIQGAEQSNRNTPANTLTALMKSMMQGVRPNGFEHQDLAVPILDAGAYRIVATHVWKAQNVSGVFVRIIKTANAPVVTFHPADVVIKSETLGDLRIFGADRWDLTGDLTNVAGYMIFSR